MEEKSIELEKVSNRIRTVKFKIEYLIYLLHRRFDAMFSRCIYLSVSVYCSFNVYLSR